MIQEIFDHKQGSTLEIAGAQIYYEIIGNLNSTKTLLFLHGGLGDLSDYNVITPAFAQEYKLIGIDSRGQGKSTLGHEPITYARLQQDVETILQHVGITNVIPIGFSDGGTIAYRMAIAKNIELPKLITLGATWSKEDAERVGQFPLALFTTEKIFQVWPENAKFYIENNPEPNLELLVQKVATQLWSDSSEEGHPYREIQKIKCPLLILRGENDSLFIEESAIQLATLLATTHVNIPEAQHDAFNQQPKKLIQLIQEFLNN